MDTLQGYLLDVQRMLVQLHKEANEAPKPFVDHTGTWRDSRTGRPINGYSSDSEESADAPDAYTSKCLAAVLLCE